MVESDSSAKPQGYLPRSVDAMVERYLRVFGAVEISGTKWCGKTWCARAHARSVSYVDKTLGLATDDPSVMLLGDRPHVIDEWQLVPAIWDVVRHEVDEQHGLRGAWILTGSSTPLGRDVGQLPKHSGAGRIGRVRMSPMSLQESGESSGKISLSGLFEGDFAPCQVSCDAPFLVDLACRGGWPEAIDLSAEDAQLIARDYLRVLRTVTMPRYGKDPLTSQRLIFSVARNLGQAATYKTLAADMGDASADSFGAPDHMIASYLQVMRDIYLLEEVPGWVPPTRSPKRVSVKPKRYLADPSLAVAALGMGPGSLLDDWQTFGLIFENLCMRDLAVYARCMDLCGDVPLRYYRDDSGLEVDAVIELTDGRWAAFEIKTSQTKVPEAVDNLQRLKAKLCKPDASRTRPPEFLAVITGIGEYAYRTDDGIYVIPITTLGV